METRQILQNINHSQNLSPDAIVVSALEASSSTISDKVSYDALFSDKGVFKSGHSLCEKYARSQQ